MKKFFELPLSFFRQHKKLAISGFIIIFVLGFFLRPKSTKSVELQTIKRGDITQTLSVTGSVSSEYIENLTFQIPGTLVFLSGRKGDQVTKGQTIAMLDERSVEKNLETALRNYSDQRNTFDQNIENNKNTPLTSSIQRVLSSNQYDLEKAVLSVELQELTKEQSVLTSPIDGYITREDVDTPGVNVTTATTFTVADLDHLIFNIDVDEADVGKVTIGQNVAVNLDAFPNQTIHLPVEKIDYQAHTTSTGGTAYTVELKMPVSERYRIGMNGDADIELAKRQGVLTIPIASIINGNTVYKKTAKGFEKQTVKLGLQNDTDAEVTSGLNDGDQIAVQPSQVSLR